MIQAESRKSIVFPPAGNIWVPRAGRRAAAAGIAMYSACLPRGVTLQRGLYAAVRLLGPRIMPGVRASWDDPVQPEVWQSLTEDWREVLGPWDSIVLYRRPNRERVGFAVLLLKAGRSVGFLRVTPSARRAEREYSIMRGIHGAAPVTFTIPEPIAFGSCDGWGWLATRSMPNRPLGALREPRARHAIAAEVGEILDQVLPRGPDTPSHWRGNHCDFAPWNLRTGRHGSVHVIDWEDAAYAPPGTDLLYGDLTARITFGTPLPSRTAREASDWLKDRLSTAILVGEAPNSLKNRLLDELRRVPTDDGSVDQGEQRVAIR